MYQYYYYDFNDEFYLFSFSVPCGDLLSFVNAMSPLDEQQSARFIRHILEGLEYLHNRNIILINIAVSSSEYFADSYSVCYYCALKINILEQN